jgi:hypothetical protein
MMPSSITLLEGCHNLEHHSRSLTALEASFTIKIFQREREGEREGGREREVGRERVRKREVERGREREREGERE